MQKRLYFSRIRMVLSPWCNAGYAKSRRFYSFYLVFLLLAGSVFSGHAVARQTAVTEKRAIGSADTKVLIVYLSRTRNTKAIAELIQQQTQGELVSIETQVPYPENYQATVDQVSRENKAGFLPKLKTQNNNIAQYDVIFLGFPTWGMQMPPPMKSFINQYGLSGKTVIPFNTNAGYGVGSGFDDVQRYCSGCTVLPGLQLKGGKERDGILFVMEGQRAVEAKTQVSQWLIKLSQTNALLNSVLSRQQRQTQ